MEGPSTCTKYDSKGQSYQTDCWSIKGGGLVNTERINDGTVLFTPVSGGGSAASVENLGDGSYQTDYTTGSTPSLNQIEAVGEATVTVPEVYSNYYQFPIETGYTVDSLPLRTVTLKSGQKGLFNRSTKELLSQSEQKIGYEAYGVDVKTEVSPKVLFLGEKNMSRSDLAVNYTILPDGEPPAGYEALSAQVDLSSAGFSGGTQWKGYLVGSSVKGTGDAVFSYGTEFDPQQDYYVQPVLNRGGDIEIQGDKVALKIISVDIDIDSDNNAGFKTDGTHNDPQRGPTEDQVEDHAGAPGKLIQPNLLDVDGDKVPGFADGIDMHGNEGDGASAPFVPLIMELHGLVLDPATTTVRFDYPGSDPAQVQQVKAADGKISYIPAPGTLRLWTRDGGKSRKATDLAAGGDYVVPGKSYTLAQLSAAASDGVWRFYVEAVRNGAGVGSERIGLFIDVDGPGPLPEMEGDAVRTTSLLAALVPDYNHDRVIDQKDIERAERGDTYYFWINDDDDEGETEGDDIPLPATSLLESRRDCDNYRVDGVRDLVDFFPVVLDLKPLFNLFPPERYGYRLKSTLEDINLVVADLHPDSIGDYLTNGDEARRVAQLPSIPVRRDGRFDDGVYQKTSQQQFNDLLLKMKNENRAGVILVEGVKPGKEPLRLEITDQAGNIAFQAELNLSIDGVEQMFRQKNIIQAALPELNPQPPEHLSEWGEPDRLDEPVNCPDDKCLNGDGSDFVFVHGYNVDGQQARGWQAETFKRLFWSGLKSRFWGVTWFGSKTQVGSVTFNYHINVRNTLYSAPALRAFLNEKMKGLTTIAAHSLGNMLVSACLNDSNADTDPNNKVTADIKNYFLIDAAVALEAYLGGTAEPYFTSTNPMVHPEWYNYKKELAASEWYTLFPADDHRSELTWRNRFENLPEGINYFNFYSSGEEVLDTHVGDPGLSDIVTDGVGRYAWALQEKLKGKMKTGWVLGSKYGGWGKNNKDYYDENTYNATGEKVAFTWIVANNQIDVNGLKTMPFFDKHFDSELFVDGNVGSGYARINRTKLLAEAFPSLTLPAGGPSGNSLNQLFAAIDMQATFTNGWPEERGKDKKWRHSDLRNVPYLYIYTIFEKMINPTGVTQ